MAGETDNLSVRSAEPLAAEDDYSREYIILGNSDDLSGDEDGEELEFNWREELNQKILGWIPVYSVFTGVGITILPFPFIYMGADLAANSFSWWRFTNSLVSFLFIFIFVLSWHRHAFIAKLAAFSACFSFLLANWPHLVNQPLASFSIVILIISVLFAVLDYDANEFDSMPAAEKRKEFVIGALSGFILLLLYTSFLSDKLNNVSVNLCALSGLLCQFMLIKRARLIKSVLPKLMTWGGFYLILLSFLGETWLISSCLVLVAFIDIVLISSMRQLKIQEELNVYFFLYRPARMMFATFVILCTLGSILLYLPISSHNGLEFIDSAFMAVSACCVTGLTVVDMPEQFTVWGKIFLILLVQLGALGIIGVASMTMLHMGRRLSLRHERVLANSLDDADQKQNMMKALSVIFYYVFGIELIGAVVLFILYFRIGIPLVQAVGKSIFTSISAFCNSGFSLDSDSLISYQNNAGILYTIVVLVLFGAMAPSTFLAIFVWFRRRHMSLAAYLALIGNFLALAVGAVSVFFAEWHNSLDALPLGDKISNALFMTAALRTAGFNSVDMSSLSNLTIVILIGLMFLGGTPGSVAGGVKTVTVMVLLLVFWADIFHNRKVICCRRAISEETIHRAIAIIIGFVCMFLIGFSILLATQNLPTKELIFEAVSAVCTVGSSLGITPYFDAVGKIIIMSLMFCGRLGPVTLFAIMADREIKNQNINYPEEKISLA
ncbi:hypothetical protein IJT93_02575 [bacterium]|nr:hypothetical protein [bacterium]